MRAKHMIRSSKAAQEVYPEALCDDMAVSRMEIEEKLSVIGYYYQEIKNQFTS